MRKLYQEFASLVDAYHRCIASPDHDPKYYTQHEETIEALVKEHMPSGSGFDTETTFDFDRSKRDRLVFNTSFHHMNANGHYDGWSEHDVIITPSLARDCGFYIRVTGRNRNEIKDYIGDVFQNLLLQEESIIHAKEDRPGFRDPNGIIGYLTHISGETGYRIVCPDPKCRTISDNVPVYAGNVRPYQITCVSCSEIIYCGAKSLRDGSDLIYNGK